MYLKTCIVSRMRVYIRIHVPIRIGEWTGGYISRVDDSSSEVLVSLLVKQVYAVVRQALAHHQHLLPLLYQRQHL